MADDQATSFVDGVFDQAYELREEKSGLHARIGANRDILRALYKANQLTTEGTREEPVLDKDGKDTGRTKTVKTGGQAEEALELYPTLLGRVVTGDADESADDAAPAAA